MRYEIKAIFADDAGIQTKFQEQSEDSDIGTAVQMFMLKMRSFYGTTLAGSTMLTLQIGALD